MSQAKIPKAPKTPEERRAQMHDLLYGAPGKASTPLSSGAVGERLLMGLTLHAARRQAQGKTLSDFEGRLCMTFRTVIEDADEAAQYGAMFAEARETMRGGRNAQAAFPQQVLGLSDDDSYTLEDLRRDVKAVVHEAAALPNYQIVDLANTTPSESESGGSRLPRRLRGVAEILSAHALERRVSGNPITLSL
ncbi:uncharacterized protein BJX67DRAFT_361569 [Aspergillus lucknowensis]|uniref:Uncharacterized protein n=1 Tax=Aspergillus lucknowensis TaxID=176173 RepID=A0ABR4LIN4_9EURO